MLFSSMITQGDHDDRCALQVGGSRRIRGGETGAGTVSVARMQALYQPTDKELKPPGVAYSLVANAAGKRKAKDKKGKEPVIVLSGSPPSSSGASDAATAHSRPTADSTADHASKSWFKRS